MRIDEILKLSSHEEYLTDWQYYFLTADEQHQLPAHAHNLDPSAHRILKIKFNADDIHLGIFDAEQFISYASMHKFLDGYQIDMTVTDSNFRSQGLIRYCIEYAVKRWGIIYSDTKQTPEAEAVWTALMNRPNTVLYQLYNVIDNTVHDLKVINNQIVPTPWNDKEDIVIRASARSVSEAILQMREDRAAWDLKKRRRDPWLGTGFLNYAP